MSHAVVDLQLHNLMRVFGCVFQFVGGDCAVVVFVVVVVFGWRWLYWIQRWRLKGEVPGGDGSHLWTSDSPPRIFCRSRGLGEINEMEVLFRFSVGSVQVLTQQFWVCFKILNFKFPSPATSACNPAYKEKGTHSDCKNFILFYPF